MKLELTHGPMNESIWCAQSEDYPIAAEGGTPSSAASALRRGIAQYTRLKSEATEEVEEVGASVKGSER